MGHGQGNPLAAPLQSRRQHLCSNPDALSFWKRKQEQQNHSGDKSGLSNSYVLSVFLGKLKINTQKSMANLLQWAGWISGSLTQKIRSNLEYISSHLFFCSFLTSYLACSDCILPLIFIKYYQIFDIKHLEALMEHRNTLINVTEIVSERLSDTKAIIRWQVTPEWPQLLRDVTPQMPEVQGALSPSLRRCEVKCINSMRYLHTLSL